MGYNGLHLDLKVQELYPVQFCEACGPKDAGQASRV